MSSILKKLGYGAETVRSVTKDAICGKELLVSKEEKEQRMSICRSCEHYTELCGQARCNECGCFAMLKTELASAKCPCGKW